MNTVRSFFILEFMVMVFAGMQIAAQEVSLPKGTAVALLLSKDISSKTAQRGDTVNFTVEKDVTVDGQVIIKQGTEAKGSVIYAEKGGYLGHSGKLAMQVESTLTVDGQTIPLSAAKGSEGDSAGRTTIALTYLVGPFGAFKKGGDTVFKQGTQLTVYTAESRRFKLEGSSLIALKPENTIAVANSGEMVTVYIFRKKDRFGYANEPSVFCDGVELARMDNGRYFMLKLAPGKHIIHMTDKKKGYEINMAGGQTYYFRIGIEVGIWKGNGKILLESIEIGAEEIKKIKPIGADKIKDKTMVVAVPST